MTTEERGKAAREAKLKRIERDKKRALFRYKVAWVEVQAFLFIVPLLFAPFIAGYDRSWDAHYIQTVNQRALDDGYAPQKLTDFSDQTVAQYDAEGGYEKKVWRQQHPELYYLNAFFKILIISLALQFFNVVWHSCYRELKQKYRRDADEILYYN